MRKDLLTLGIPLIISILLCIGKYLAWFGSVLNPAFVYIFLITLVSFYLLLDGIVKGRSNSLATYHKIRYAILLLAIPIHLICIYGIYYYCSHNQYYIRNAGDEAIELMNIIGCDRKNIDQTLSPGKTKRFVIEAKDNCRNVLSFTKEGKKESLVLPTPERNTMNRVNQKIQ